MNINEWDGNNLMKSELYYKDNNGNWYLYSKQTYTYKSYNALPLPGAYVDSKSVQVEYIYGLAIASIKEEYFYEDGTLEYEGLVTFNYVSY